MVVLFKDSFILLLNKVWGRKKMYAKFTNRERVPLSEQETHIESH